MKKQIFTLILFFCSSLSFSNTHLREFVYSVVFIGCFENDNVSLSINKTLLLDQYKLANLDSLKKGHLSLTQSDEEIKIFYNGRQIIKSKIEVDFVLLFDITVNGISNKFNVDLRKGRIILVDYSINDNKYPGKKSIIIDQLQEPFIW